MTETPTTTQAPGAEAPAATPLPPAAAHAEVATAEASRYLQQLCKHFAHKVPATFDAERGEIRFSIGTCRLAARDGRLVMDLDAPNGADMPALQDVVVRHLARFAFREELAVSWRAA